MMDFESDALGARDGPLLEIVPLLASPALFASLFGR